MSKAEMAEVITVTNSESRIKVKTLKGRFQKYVLNLNELDVAGSRVYIFLLVSLSDLM